MEIKTILYIVAAIIYLYSRSKKKDKNPTGQTQPEVEEEETDFDWEETLRKLTGEEAKLKPPLRPSSDPFSFETPKPVAETWSYENTSKPVRDYDEEVIRNRKQREKVEEETTQQKQHNIEQEALQKHKARSSEETGVLRSLSSIQAPHSLDDYHAEPIDVSVEELRKGFIYGEILTPKYF